MTKDFLLIIFNNGILLYTKYKEYVTPKLKSENSLRFCSLPFEKGLPHIISFEVLIFEWKHLVKELETIVVKSKYVFSTKPERQKMGSNYNDLVLNL